MGLTASQIKKVHASLSPENLAKVVLKFDPKKTALIIVDSQPAFTSKDKRGNDETETVSKKIANLLPAFRKAGITVYAIYTASFYQPRREEVDFSHFTPEAEDRVVRKRYDSAFNMTSLKEELQEDKKKNLLVCGFNLSACVLHTVIDGCKEKFKTAVLHDLVGNDKGNAHLNRFENYEDMAEAGAKFTTSKTALKNLRQTRK